MYNNITSNFIVSNYGAGFGVDNDDTSSYYNINNNVFYLGGGVKCDYVRFPPPLLPPEKPNLLVLPQF